MLRLFVSLHVALQQSCSEENGCGSGVGAVGLWTPFSPSVADYDTKGFTT